MLDWRPNLNDVDKKDISNTEQKWNDKDNTIVDNENDKDNTLCIALLYRLLYYLHMKFPNLQISFFVGFQSRFYKLGIVRTNVPMSGTVSFCTYES